MDSWVVPLVALAFGLTLGSFLNVCSIRWPQDRSVIVPGSACPACGTSIRWYDNTPILGWLLLRGRCRRCAAGISLQYPAVEAATGLVWAGSFLVWGPGVEAVRGAIFLTILLGIAASDARFYIIPDQFSLGGAAVGFALSFFSPEITWASSLVGASVGFLLLWFVAWAGEKAFRKEAMGGGDIKMMAMIGAFLGVWGVFLSLFLGALLGTIVFGPVSWRTGRLIPFGIFLAVGAAVTYGWGEALVGWYLDWAFPA